MYHVMMGGATLPHTLHCKSLAAPRLMKVHFLLLPHIFLLHVATEARKLEIVE